LDVRTTQNLKGTFHVDKCYKFAVKLVNPYKITLWIFRYKYCMFNLILNEIVYLERSMVKYL